MVEKEIQSLLSREISNLQLKLDMPLSNKQKGKEETVEKEIQSLLSKEINNLEIKLDMALSNKQKGKEVMEVPHLCPSTFQAPESL